MLNHELTIETYIEFAREASDIRLAEATYKLKLLPFLREQIGALHRAFFFSYSDPARRLFDAWTGTQAFIRMNEALTTMHRRFGEMPEMYDQYRVGMVELGNMVLGVTNQPDRRQQIKHFCEYHEPDTLPVRTLDGQHRYFPLELCLNEVRAAQSAGKVQEADKIVLSGIRRTQKVVDELQDRVSPHLEIPNHMLQELGYQTHKNVWIYLSAHSAQYELRGLLSESSLYRDYSPYFEQIDSIYLSSSCHCVSNSRGGRKR